MVLGEPNAILMLRILFAPATAVNWLAKAAPPAAVVPTASSALPSSRKYTFGHVPQGKPPPANTPAAFVQANAAIELHTPPEVQQPPGCPHAAAPQVTPGPANAPPEATHADCWMLGVQLP